MTKKKHKNAIISHPKFGGGGQTTTPGFPDLKLTVQIEYVIVM